MIKLILVRRHSEVRPVLDELKELGFKVNYVTNRCQQGIHLAYVMQASSPNLHSMLVNLNFSQVDMSEDTQAVLEPAILRMISSRVRLRA